MVPVCSAVATLLLSVSATVELSTAGAVVGFCRAAGYRVWKFVHKLVGNTSGITRSDPAVLLFSQLQVTWYVAWQHAVGTCEWPVMKLQQEL